MGRTIEGENTEGYSLKRDNSVIWCVGAIILLIAYFALIGVFIFFQNGQAHYLDGLNGTFIGMGRHFCSIPLWLIMVIVFSGLGTCLYFSELSVGVKIGSVAVLLLINPLFVIIPFFFDTPRHVNFTEGYRDWAKSVLNIQEIREWMEDLKNTESFGIYDDFQGPKCLVENHSRFSAGLIFDEEGHRVLRIMSGGGFQDWGIVIGPVEMEVPESENYKYSGGASEYRLKLENGVYVYYELQ